MQAEELPDLRHHFIVPDRDVAYLDGNSLERGKTPSAETLLHTQLYRWRPQIGAVLHF